MREEKQAVCFLCGTGESVEWCGECEAVASCPPHRLQHRHPSSDRCLPFTVTEVAGSGRGLAATRDILKGELVLAARPAALGPRADCSETLCPDCLLPLPGPVHQTCPDCGLWLCGAGCGAGAHQGRC